MLTQSGGVASGGCARRQRGLSLVELMVGVAIGLFVVAGAATVTATQFSDSSRLVAETQVQQDLRASADIMTREIRRAGYWGAAGAAVRPPVAAVVTNPFDAVSQTTRTELRIALDNTATTTRVFELASQTVLGRAIGVIQMDMGSGPQTLTDPFIMDVTALDFEIVPVQINLACTADCPVGTPGGAKACWPQMEVREVRISITATSRTDNSVVRSVRSAARLRNDRIINRNGGGPLCPV